MSAEYQGNLGLKEDLQRLSQLLGELRLRVEKLERTARVAHDAAIEEESRG